MAPNTNQPAEKDFSPLKRRAFLKYSGFGIAASAAALAGCEDGLLGPNNNPNSKPADNEIDLGSGDIGILNYAYALEQLEAGFYTMVVAADGFSGRYSEEEQEILQDLKAHEIIHREFLKTALGTNAIPSLTPNFDSIDFTSRDAVLATAKVFEDLGVAAYNGAGKLLVDANLLLVAGKIVSVEARHASAIRDVINPLSMDFAGDDVIDENGFDQALMPPEVLAAAQPYVKEKLNGSNLPIE
ncbi:MAG TPA: ferritin-like domain-containing protein [Chryseosolibacter sp.]|nr:ferritin-like domain-containing protein [Chryseosolibacter sp.]